MIDDPIVAEVRKAREDYARQFNYDLDAICRDLEEKQLAPGRKLAPPPPMRRKRPRTTRPAVASALPGRKRTNEPDVPRK
jgi:hypothetical protein